MTTSEEVAKNIVFDDTKGQSNLISYSIKNNANGDSWKEIKVIFNGSDQPRTVKIPKAQWIVIAEDGTINAEGLGNSNGGRLTVAPRSAMILAREK